MTKCRCGWDGQGIHHPCHGNNYQCKNPGKQRFVSTFPSSLSGFQMKLSAYESWACDECWNDYCEKIKKISGN